MVLIHDDLWDCVSTPENKNEDVKKQEKALAKIALSVKPCVFPQIRNAKSAREAWSNLQKAYEDRENARRDENSADVTALAARKVPKPIKCFRCKKSGHFKKDCPDNSDGKKSGHFKKDCPDDSDVKKSGRRSQAHLTALAAGVKRDVWYVDSGAAQHFCNDRRFLSDFTNEKSKKVLIANGEALPTAGKGTAQTVLKDNSVRSISNVYLVPKLSANLLSVSAMDKKGFEIVFRSGVCTVYDNGEVLATATLRDGIYELDAIETVSVSCCEPSSQAMCSSLSVGTGDSKAVPTRQLKVDSRPVDVSVKQAPQSPATGSQSTQQIWHRRLAHLNTRSMELLRKEVPEEVWDSTPDHGSKVISSERSRGTRNQNCYRES
ncbi:hypothetical protein PYW07_004743 [Mythimna separata]|uniref:CCHC-type domain-containing protein n=1 Tax=Mythimna separata TaxID=271217 RepID=A0AAD8DYX8_MYTSE|nr:hypothetical protein PYW07_004743 [Mythimna separata]